MLFEINETRNSFLYNLHVISKEREGTEDRISKNGVYRIVESGFGDRHFPFLLMQC